MIFARPFSTLLERSPLNADRWLQGLYDQIDTLERFPGRCSYAREREYLDDELRQLLYKSHRIVFHIDPATSTVFVVRVMHARRRAVGEPDVNEGEER